MKNLKLQFYSLIVTMFVFFFMFSADTYALFRIPNPSVCDDISCLLERLGNFLRPLAGLSFLIMFTFGGILYMTGRDNDDQLKKARSVLIGAFAGIVIVLAAPTLIEFVLSLFRNPFT